MPFAASLSEHPLATHATGEVVGDLLDQLRLEPDEPVDLVTVFVTAPHVGVLEDVPSTVRALLRPRSLLGASAVSVLAGAHEAEETSAVSVFAARWRARSPIDLTPVCLDELYDADAWLAASPLADCATDSTLLLLADPFSVPIRDLLGALTSHRPDIAVVGGMASAAQGPGGNRLVLDGRVTTSGAVGVIVGPEAHVGTRACRRAAGRSARRSS